MIKLFLFGINGKMGRMICECVKNKENIEVTGGFDINPSSSYAVFNDINKVDVPYDVLVDFSRPETLDTIIQLTTKNPRPVVLATTGYDENALKKIDNLAKEVPVFITGNMSVGINVLLDLAESAAKKLFESSDIEIIEKHHNQKVDSPSGTAAMIANAVNSSMDNKANFIYGREGNNTKRKKYDVGIHSVRGGTIVGEHEILFCSEDEIISISHTALSRKVFAEGAIRAAQFIMNKPCGKYNMKDLLK